MGGWGLFRVQVFQGIAPCCATLLAAGCNTEACSELSCMAQLVPYSRWDMGAWVGFLPPCHINLLSACLDDPTAGASGATAGASGAR